MKKEKQSPKVIQAILTGKAVQALEAIWEHPDLSQGQIDEMLTLLKRHAERLRSMNNQAYRDDLKARLASISDQ